MAAPNKMLPYVRPLIKGIVDPMGRYPKVGEMVFVRLPYEFQEEEPLVIDLTPGVANLYPLIITETFTYKRGNYAAWQLKGLPCRSLGLQGIEHARSLRPEIQRMLLPLPSVEGAPTPPEFGSPLEIAGYIGQKPRWVLAYEILLDMGDTGKFKPVSPMAIMAWEQVQRIKDYKHFRTHRT